MEASEVPVATVTQRSQKSVESQVGRIYEGFAKLPPDAQFRMLELKRENHIDYLKGGLRQLPSSFCILDALRPWVCFWNLHSSALLGESVDDQLQNNIVDFLSRCQDPNGGYGGGPAQMPHLATTYAAVCSLVTLGGHKALSSINRSEMYMFLRQMKHPSGGFRIHDGGEIDVRACYAAISVASILNILDDELVQNVGNYILSCQTYEGGISAEPGTEAHGGYTFCGVATMIMINQVNQLDLPRLIDWLVFQQGKECGFKGRTNKLVDCCYSFWQGGTFALLQRACSTIDQQLVIPVGGNTFKVNFNDIGHNFVKRRVEMEPLFDGRALQLYLLLCSQEENGGLKDKPGKSRDFYHTCYALSGLSLSQHIWSDDESLLMPRAVLGPYSNLLEPIHPLFNVVLERYHEARDFFTTFWLSNIIVL
ncbi:PREDICTED: farnesyltransferase [Prunus dulcis]|uniref:Protein farnesyltransferase subunit beta n=1 Tax=Prunus dulcis TaxID=3755 RepID=A0A5E4EB13_PRUDU|nr:protein farnesyltransferase subunit beta-like [Prunus dulcis]VVA12953.1 PREDICTED: farnesyltransferase [Prunus dulcis]